MTRLPRPPLILAYHGISVVPLGRPGASMFVRPRDLARQIDLLRRWGYRLTTFGELAAAVAGGAGEGIASLTFDDGLADNAHNLAPVLTRIGAPATIFVVSGWLGGRHRHANWAPMLTRSDLRSLHSQGIEIGAHTRSHVDLRSVSRERAFEELSASRLELEAIIQSPVDVAAYPYGSASSSVVEACRAAGFRAACLASGEGSWREPLRLPRQDVANASSSLGLWLKRHDVYESLMRLRAARAGRRMTRRLRARPR